MFTRETIKQALISIAVGASIAFISTLLNGLLHFVQTIPFDSASTVAGIAYYIKQWHSSQLV
jgi:hypothetical protein